MRVARSASPSPGPSAPASARRAGKPSQRPLHDRRPDTALDQVADGERGQGAIDSQVGPEQGAARRHRPGRGPPAPGCGARWTADGGIATDSQRRPRPLEAVLVRRQRQMADPAARGDPGAGQVRRQPLLELARAPRSRSAPDGAAGRSRGRRGGRLDRPPTRRRPAPRRPPGRHGRRPPSRRGRSGSSFPRRGRGGDSEAVAEQAEGRGRPQPHGHAPPPTATSTSSRAQPGRPSRAASVAEPPEASASAPGLGGAVGERQRVAGEKQLQRDEGGEEQRRDRGDELDRGLSALVTHRPPTSRRRRRSAAASPAAGAAPAPRPRPVRRRATRAPRRIDSGSARRAARRGIPADQRRPRPGPRRDAGRPQRLTGEGELSGDQDRQEKERQHPDELDRGRPGLAAAPGSPTVHAPTVPGRGSRVARRNERFGRGSAQYVFASIQIRQMAATEAARRSSQARVPPPVANISSLPAISSAIRPTAP